jgi:regulator of sigma E protease
VGLAGASPEIPPVIGEVVEGDPAAAAGLQSGDRVLSVDGVALETWLDLVHAVRNAPDVALNLESSAMGGSSRSA